MEFRLLGPLEVVDRGEPVVVGGGKQRAVLAILLLRANEVVSRERLIDDVWRGAPPDSAGGTLHTYVSRLRRALGGGRIVTQLPGYMLDAEPEELDVVRFERLARSGRDALARGENAEAADLLERAMALWRGTPLAEFECEAFAQADIARFEERRLATLEDRLDADLALGRHGDVAVALEPLIARYPLRERLRGQLMLALYRGGRQADALAAYRDARGLLVDELGIDPSPPLQQLHARILVQDPTLDVPVAARGALAPAVVQASPHRVRKTVTVVAVDLRGAADPESLASARARAADVATPSLRTHGALVEAGAGGLVATFGVPALHEDDAVRAVRAVDAVRGALATLTDALPLEFRIGVETAEVLAAGAHVVEGTAVADARRLAESAPAGEAVLGERTKRAVGRIAGVERSLAGWRLLSVRRTGEAMRRRVRSPLVGRATELAQLRHAFAAAEAKRSCHLFTLLGPAGIGKSRLARELAVALGKRATTLTGRCLPYGDGITFWPLAEIVKQAAGNTAPGAIAPVLHGDPRAAAIADRIASALGVAGAHADGEETLWAFRSFLEALSRRRPLLVVFEDIHWAEPTLLDFIEHLAERSRDAPMLVLCLARPELLDERRGWSGGKANATSLLLEGLTEPEVSELIDSLTRDRLLSEAARKRIAEAAEGNPLFIEQMLAHAGDRAGDGLTIPQSIQALLAARLDRLPVHERHVLERAAIVGREFTVAAVRELSPATERAAVERILDELVRKELVTPDHSDETSDDAFRFSHLLVRDTAYAAIPKATRAELHEEFADHIDDAFADRSGELDEIVGFHLEQAHAYRTELDPAADGLEPLALRAADRLARAGRRARDRSDVPAAIALLDRAAAIAPDESALQVETLLSLAYAHADMGAWRAARESLKRANAVARQRNEHQLTLRAAICSLQLKLFTKRRFTSDEFAASADSILRRLTALGDDRYRASADTLLAWARMLQGHYAEAERLFQDALEIGLAERDSSIVAHVNKQIVAVWVYGPKPLIEAVALCEEMLEHERSVRVSAQIHRALAHLYAMKGDFAQATEAITTAEGAHEVLGSPNLSVVVLETKASLQRLAGDAAGAIGTAESALNRLASDEMLWRPSVSAVLAAANADAGLYEDALRLTQRIEAACPRDIETAISWRSTRARVLAALGDAKAEAIAREAVALSCRTDLLASQAGALFALSVAQRERRRDLAAQAARASLSKYRAKGDVVSATAVRRFLTSLA